MIASEIPIDPSQDETFGLRHWMERVLQEAERTSTDFSPDHIHDLRVALRRCRSIAAGYMTIDPDKTWKALTREARRLFKRLGELRDVQVMEEWVDRLGMQEDPVYSAMTACFAARRQELELRAMKALSEFDRDSWGRWIQRLHRRSRNIPLGGAVFQLNALNAWKAAHRLHGEALRNRSNPAFHRLRIGIKKFRYIVESFLPQLHQEWGGDLKALQDWLGDVHDLAVFWNTGVQIHAFPDAESRNCWRRRINEEKAERLEKYRIKMLGKQSLWKIWRSGLPPTNCLTSLNLSMIQTWAKFQGINLKQAGMLRRLALQLYDGLDPKTNPVQPETIDWRTIMHAATLLHRVYKTKGKRRSDKLYDRLLQRLPILPGFSSEWLRLVTLVVHYSNIKLRNISGAESADLPETQRRAVMELAGILRLAAVLVRNSDPPIRKLIVEQSGESILILTENYSEFGWVAQKAAHARYLLEYSCKKPILIRNLTS
ncbi:MAG TPA: CHAD domain-containing protein [Acidobacteriota bacterium]|nr:CHAD domain-containing protein [Acidobacteriota bacterium]